MPVIRRILVARGTVQGVGFRPFVYRKAVGLGLVGTVRNQPDGVHIDVEGDPAAIDRLVHALRTEAPKLARVESVDSSSATPQGAHGFSIGESATSGAPTALPPADVAPCAECRREMDDPQGRRHRYPFINCTACGPRFSILASLPYDRPRTTMAAFDLCDACRLEYLSPDNRRFHAEPNACAVCGPTITFEAESESRAHVTGEAALLGCIEALRRGEVVAIKGVGGFHLAVDARSSAAVTRLRARKAREAKPFALMGADLASVDVYALVTPAERELLEDRARPIVLLARRPATDLASEVAPGLRELGFMLPPSPLHQLIADGFGGPLVMTSGNLSEEPIARGNDEARRRLAEVADAFLLHDRDIVSRLDDSLVRSERGVARRLRRARGDVPCAVPLASSRALLAVGADLKSTFCIATSGIAVVSQHLGGLGSAGARAAWIEALATWSTLLTFEPETVVCDLHPDYASTRFAESLALPLFRVQHHHAHVAACLAEHGREGPVVGVAFDGAGYGHDGAVWGGEFLVADRRRADRAAHLRYVRQPGGDRAAREPWRMALAYLDDAGIPLQRCNVPSGREAEIEPLARAMRKGVASPWTSSAGRLFDAVAALAGLRSVGQFEGQAAMELDAVSGPPGAWEPGETPYPFTVGLGLTGGDPRLIDLRETVRAIAQDAHEGRPIGEIGARFHATVAAVIVQTASALARERGLGTVVLTGGCFQNARLAAACEAGLEALGLETLRPARFPPNDGGVSLGQAAIAAACLDAMAGRGA